MNSVEAVPCLPENAPFTAEQRAYLNGFLAGLFSRAPEPSFSSSPSAPASAAPLVPLSILFGSQTGNAERLAKRAAKEAGRRGFAATTHELAQYPVTQLAAEQRALVITSTYGDGEPPDNAKAFWSALESPNAPKLTQLAFSVCALGDSNYPKFCGFGKALDARLESLGGQRIHDRADCDVDSDDTFAQWLNEALNIVGKPSGVTGQTFAAAATDAPAPSDTGYSRTRPFPATLRANRKLNADGSAKDTRHFEIDLGHSGLTYEAGDALGVFPENCPELVADVLNTAGYSGDEMVPGRNGPEVALREALRHDYEITRIPAPFLAALAERTGDSELKKLSAPEANGALTRFLWGREIIDLLLAHPAARFRPEEFVRLLRKIQPRLYSISSSPKLHPDGVHLTVNVVRYESLFRRRKGVCSTFLADRGKSVPVFIQPNANFRVPARGDVPLIMIGPGTGIAPFRAFLQERQATGARGKNWLFFGDQHAATDFLYRDELEEMLRGGTLTRLDTAFSRDQADKIYVQHRIREHARELFAWLEEGGFVYVCGDAVRMAKDVEAALLEAIQAGGGRSQAQALEYLNRLKTERRYQRDVY